MTLTPLILTPLILPFRYNTKFGASVSESKTHRVAFGGPGQHCLVTFYH